MSDTSSELVAAPDTENYPVILDLVTDEQLAEGQRVFRKEQPLAEGAFAGTHNAWKRDQVRLLLEKVSDAETFVCVSRVVGAANDQLREKTERDLHQITLESIASLLRGAQPANEATPVAAAA